MLGREKNVQNQLRQVVDHLRAGELSRYTISSKEWHAANINAATSLFGFSSWKEFVCYVHALFGLYPPMTQSTPGDAISKFEWCLAAKLRINCRLSYRTIAFILGLKSESNVAEQVKKWVYEWGEAGEDLSILDITEEFLESTCPQAYIDEGLDKICGIPDGKDFKIHTPRKNTLFTRACSLLELWKRL